MKNESKIALAKALQKLTILKEVEKEIYNAHENLFAAQAKRDRLEEAIDIQANKLSPEDLDTFNKEWDN